MAKLGGFARLEKQSWWKQEGNATAVDILADTFTEQDTEFRVPNGRIAALGLRKEVVVNGKIIGQPKSVKILTREARTELEKSIHHRFPVVIVKDEDKGGYKLYEFTEKDVVSSESPIQKELDLGDPDF
jgi:hypothetical protein